MRPPEEMAALYPSDWPLIELHSVGPDGKTCSCAKGRNCPEKTAGKHPKIRGWENVENLTDPKTWRIKANIGVLTGKPSGFFVLDVDSGGLEAMKALVAENGGIGEPTRVHQTGSGTFHYFFAMPDFDVTNRHGDLPEGVDVRGTGGQVVLPPSISGKGPYSLIVDAPIQPAPEWLLDLIRPSGEDFVEVDGFGDFGPPWPPGHDPDSDDETPVDSPAEAAEEVAPPSPAVTSSSAPDAFDEFFAPSMTTDRAERYEVTIVEAEVARLVAMRDGAQASMDAYKGEPWDSTTYEVAAKLFELANATWSALTKDQARDLVLEHAPRDDGFDDDRVKEKIRSALKTVGSKARELPAPPVERPAATDSTPPPSGEGVTPSQAQAPKAALPPGDYFGKEGLLAADLGQAVIDYAPIRLGQNRRWWTWSESGVWVEDPEAVTNRCVDILKNRFRTAHSSNAEVVVRRFAGRLQIDAPDARWMNFRNGMLDWRTGEIVPHDESMSSTIQFPHDYDPAATCPRFDAFLDSVMSPDYQRLAWEMIAYLLYSGNPLQTAFLMHGSGGNGKGTLIKVITAMLGEANVANQSLDALNGNRFAPANLFGKIANIAGDIDATFQESTATFKMLTGEDRYSGEYKYGDSFSFENYAVPVFSANKIPGSADVSKGYLRRWVNIEFDRQFTGDPIPGLGEMLAASEVPGVVAKALKVLPGLLEAAKFTVAGEAEKGREGFARSIDQVRQWVEDECMPDPDKRFVAQHELYQDYSFWATRNGNHRLKAAEFYNRLEGAGYERAKVKGTRGFKGLILMKSHGADYNQAQPTTAEAMDDFFKGGS